MDQRHSTSAEVFRLMYRSRDLVPAADRADELSDLFSRSRSNNQKRGITGALLLSGRWFVQVLEGDEAAVRSLYATIREDPRHDEVIMLDEGMAKQTFRNWSMAEVSIPDSYLPLIARISEVSTGRGSTPEREDLLTAMLTALDDAGEAVDVSPPPAT